MEKSKEGFLFPDSFADYELEKEQQGQQQEQPQQNSTLGEGHRENPRTSDEPSSPFLSGIKSHQNAESFSPKHEVTPDRKKGSSLLSFIADELERDYMLEQNEKKLKERRKRVYTFVKTPKHLEKFLFFGTMLCLDVFLFIFTFLPIRVLIALYRGFRRLCSAGQGKLLDPMQKVDLLKGIILVTVSLSMEYIDTSVIYHVVRVQSVIKLYVIYNMLDMADKLLASFGQDVLDALYWTATEPRGRRREHVGIIPHLLLSLVYVAVHMILNLSQAIVLNVAINSFNKALLTIMISNQFIEIKSSVFKRFEKNNLFQISCSDARERFHYFIILFVVAVRNFAEYDWNLEYAYNSFLPFALVVIGSELLVDWFKHAFITKFNNIQPEVYSTYRRFLAQNILAGKHDAVFTGHTDQVSRRMGFTAIPLAVLLVKVLRQCITLSGVSGICFAIAGYLCLCATKLLVSIHIFGKAWEYINEEAAGSSEGKHQDKLYKPSWTFEPMSSVQDIHGGFNSDIHLFSSSKTSVR